MRVNLITQTASSFEFGAKSVPLSLTIRPSCGLPGDYQYATDSAALLRMLRKKTDLPFDTLKRFEGEIYNNPSARLLGVELSESVLTELGYFID
jgi:hypothetical protein